MQDIMNTLNNEGIPSPRGKKWYMHSIRDVLMNEVYKGDIILQKYISIDHLTHKSIRNDATEVPSYYIHDHHPAIVSKETFERVQKIQVLRSSVNDHIPQYPYGETEIFCPLCGAALVQRNTHGNYKARIALGCFTDKGCGKFAIRKYLLNEAMMRAYNELDAGELGDWTGEEANGRYAAGAECRHAYKLKQMKESNPTIDSVEFYWLDEQVERIELYYVECEHVSNSAGHCNITVRWRCRLKSSLTVSLGRKCNEPETVAALYYTNVAKYRARYAAKNI